MLDYISYTGAINRFVNKVEVMTLALCSNSANLCHCLYFVSKLNNTNICIIIIRLTSPN